MRKRPLGKIFIISGPSGSGKTTLLKKLLKVKELKAKLAKSISITTRLKRSGEKAGKDYFFTDSANFKRLLKAKKILEWTRYLGYYYGTPKEFVDKQLKQGKSIGLCLDLKGARILKQMYPKAAVTIFVRPPSIGELKVRIQGRSDSCDKRELQKRLKLAVKELRGKRKFDFSILHKDLRQALNTLKGIVLLKINQRTKELKN